MEDSLPITSLCWVLLSSQLVEVIHCAFSSRVEQIPSQEQCLSIYAEAQFVFEVSELRKLLLARIISTGICHNVCVNKGPFGNRVSQACLGPGRSLGFLLTWSCFCRASKAIAPHVTACRLAYFPSRYS